MRVTKLDYFIDKIVAATVATEKLRDTVFLQSKEIKKLEEHITLLKEACEYKDDRIKELESLAQFNPEEVPDCPTEFTLHNVEYLEDPRGYFKSADKIMHPGKHIEISQQEYLDAVNQHLKTQE
jgi:hypothetical protein